MSPFLKRKHRKKRRHGKSDGKDQRATALRLAGLELLAGLDFENVSIAKIVKEARCSVGAFYYRYKNKNTYLRQRITMTFRGLENSFSNSYGVKSSSTISLSEFISHIITKLSTRENAGIIRVALKLGTTEPDALRPYEDYRESVTATAESIFKSKSKKKIQVKKIRQSLQLVFAAINDAALMPKNAAMKLGGDEMTNALCESVAAHIGVKPIIQGK